MRPFIVIIPLKSDIKYIEHLIAEGYSFTVKAHAKVEHCYTIKIKSGKRFWLNIDRDKEHDHIEVSFGFGSIHFLDFFGFMAKDLPDGCKWIWPENGINEKF